jgi:hypothetical protein
MTHVKIVRDKDGLVTSAVDASGTTTNVYYPSTWLKTMTVSAGVSKTLTYQYNGWTAPLGLDTRKRPDPGTVC